MTASAIRARLGVCPQQDSLDPELTVKENLVTYARYFGIPRRVAKARADELLEFVQLTDRAGSKVEPLSGGMKRRLTIARALVNEPEIVLLDEPTTGLDPQARHLVWERLFRLKQQGVTLVLTTHYMDEAEQLCDRLVVMDGGKIVAEGSPRALIDKYSTREVVELRFGTDVLADYADKVAAFGERVEVLPDRILLYAVDGDAASEAIHDSGLRPVQRAGPTQHPGGRVPAPHRPDVGGLMTAATITRPPRGLAPALSVLEFDLVGYKRTWRGSVLSSFVLPVLFVLGFGVSVGHFVDAGGKLGRSATSTSSCPGCSPPTRCSWASASAPTSC